MIRLLLVHASALQWLAGCTLLTALVCRVGADAQQAVTEYGDDIQRG